MHYYNENDLKAAAWLRELMKAGHIPEGHIDTRSIHEVTPNDLAGFIQCHFFAGIGGWPYALRLAGWAQEKPCWTGSCPCQPYSSAGKGLGDADPRNLWPVWFALIKECRPKFIFGEQVASAIKFGWLDGVSSDLETQGYAVGSCVLGAHSVGAPHIRQRLYWVADAASKRQPSRFTELHGDTGEAESHGSEIGCRLDNSGSIGRRESRNDDRAHDRLVADSTNAARWMGEPIQQGLEGHTGNVTDGDEPRRNNAETIGSITTPSCASRMEHTTLSESTRFGQQSEFLSGQTIERPWDSYELLPCTDGKARRIEPGTFPLAHGVSGRVGLLRGYGNAIVPQDAAVFIKAFQETIESR